MGVTDITMFHNLTGYNLFIQVLENRSLDFEILKGQFAIKSVWIPWVNTDQEMRSKSIKIMYSDANGIRSIYLFQSGDCVYYATNFFTEKRAVYGVSGVDGKRECLIEMNQNGLCVSMKS